MKVAHITATPLAGSPIRIVNALNKYTDVQARLINLDANAYGVRTFPEDLLWATQRATCEAVIREADILHFHHWFDFSSIENPFRFDFLSAMKGGARYLMHWHSNPMAISSLTGQSIQDIVNAPVPQMVVAQFHESYYPNAYPVPLIVEVESLSPEITQRPKPIITYSPSRGRHAYEDRWETKGKPEVIRILEGAKSAGYLDYRLIEDIPFQECMRLRSECDMVIDDIVTGSFHTTSLEAMAAGKPTLSYMDKRTQMVLSQLTGTTDCPLINVRFPDAVAVLKELSLDQQLRTDIGRFSREWMLEYYSECKMIEHYRIGYASLMKTGVLFNSRYIKHRNAKLWLYTRLPDLQWHAQMNNEISLSGRMINLRHYKKVLKDFLSKHPMLLSSIRSMKAKFRSQHK